MPNNVQSGAIAVVNLMDQPVTLAINGAKLTKDKISLGLSTPFKITPVVWDTAGNPPPTPVPGQVQFQATMVAVPLLPSTMASLAYFTANSSTNTLLVTTDSGEFPPLSLTIDMSTVDLAASGTIYIADAPAGGGSVSVWAVNDHGTVLPIAVGS